MAYASIRVTTADASTAVASTASGGVTACTTEAVSTIYELVNISFDAANDILSGVTTDGAKVVFQAGATFTISLTAA